MVRRIIMKYKTKDSSSRSFLAAIMAVILASHVFLATGCGRRVTAIQNPPPERGTVVNRERVPVLICVLDDKTLSMRKARSTPVQEKDLRELLELLRQTGGELGYGLIGEAS